jgi:hypothetical protein
MKIWMTLVLLAGVLCVPNAEALVSEFVLPSDSTVNVTVISTVTEITPGSEYLYTYQITEIDEAITMLSVPFPVSLTQSTEIYEFASNGPAPIYWGPINDPAIAAQAFFASALLVVDTSGELTFKSIYPAQEVQGYVTEAQMGSLYGTLLAPVPEPLTLSFLAMGAGILIRKKNTFNNNMKMDYRRA